MNEVLYWKPILHDFLKTMKQELIEDGLLAVELRNSFGKFYNEDGSNASFDEELDFYEKFR